MGWGGEWAHFHLPLYPLYALVNRKVAIGNFPRHCSCSFDSIWLKLYQNGVPRNCLFLLGASLLKWKMMFVVTHLKRLSFPQRIGLYMHFKLNPKRWIRWFKSYHPLNSYLALNSKTVGLSSFIASSFTYILEKTLKKVFKCSAWIHCTAWWLGISFWCMH